MKEYDVYVPLYLNDGTPIALEYFEALQQELVDRFGGVTYSPQPKKGVWKMGEVVYRDEIVIFSVVALGEERAYFSLLKERMKSDLQQKEILILERDVGAI